MEMNEKKVYEDESSFNVPAIGVSLNVSERIR